MAIDVAIALRNRRTLSALIAAVCVTVSACGYDGPERSLPVSSPLITTTTSTAPPASTPVRTAGSSPAAPRVTDRLASASPTTAPVPTTAMPAMSAPLAETIVPTAPPTTTIPEPRTPRQVLVIGDSSAAAMRWTAGATDALRGADFTLDLESCRRLVEPSCDGVEGYAPSTALDALRSNADGSYDTLIMATGYNDMDRDFVDAFDRITAEARLQGITTILWTTYRERIGDQIAEGAGEAYAEMNDVLALRMRSGQHPELHLVDWWGYTEDADSWLTSDGIHLTGMGAYGMADLISRTIAALDGRACPLPWEFSAEPVDPCPPPVEQLARRGEVPAVKEMYDALR